MATLYTPQVISRTTKSVDWLFERQQQAMDDAIEAAYERRCLIEDAVSFDDVIEEMADFNPARAQVFMEALKLGGNKDVHTLYCLLDQAFEAIVKRRLAGGE